MDAGVKRGSNAPPKWLTEGQIERGRRGGMWGLGPDGYLGLIG